MTFTEVTYIREWQRVSTLSIATINARTYVKMWITGVSVHQYR